jgi:hypothetical protein
MLQSAAMLFVSYSAAVFFGLEWASGETASLVWPASGVALAGLMIGGLELTPVLFLAYVAVARLADSEVPLWTDAAIALVTASVAAMTATILQSWTRIDPRLTSVRDVVRLSILTLLGGVVSALAEEGIGLAIDDFGIGCSSLNYLMKLPISKVKIDRSFVAGLNDQRNATLVEGIVSLGHRLEKRIVAEGVQTENQLERLRAIGWR